MIIEEGEESVLCVECSWKYLGEISRFFLDFCYF